MAQEYIEGGSLQDELVRKGPAQLDTAVRYCAGIAAGLEAVHEAGLIHRDLKPGNVLLDGQGTVKITDFGLVKDFDATVLTAPGQAVGSMDYMAPEQIRGADVTPQTDVYALGCVMCDLFTGKPPFADRQGMQILYAHLEDEPPDPCATRPDLPAEVGRVIGCALEKEPHMRPSDAMAFARMLEKAASNQS
jgi:serine/threonine-protein kinase